MTKSKNPSPTRVKARNLASLVAKYDVAHGDLMDLRFGGDGDNGEALIAALEWALESNETLPKTSTTTDELEKEVKRLTATLDLIRKGAPTYLAEPRDVWYMERATRALDKDRKYDKYESHLQTESVSKNPGKNTDLKASSGGYMSVDRNAAWKNNLDVITQLAADWPAATESTEAAKGQENAGRTEGHNLGIVSASVADNTNSTCGTNSIHSGDVARLGKTVEFWERTHSEMVDASIKREERIAEQNAKIAELEQELNLAKNLLKERFEISKRVSDSEKE